MITATSPLRILIVDDDIDIAESTATVFRMHGHQASTAYMLTTAMMAVQSNRPNVLVVDIGLPGANGYQVAKQLLTMMPTKPLMIAHTGFSEELDRQRALGAGFDHFIVKPADPEMLQSILDSYAKSLLDD